MHFAVGELRKTLDPKDVIVYLEREIRPPRRPLANRFIVENSVE